MNVTINYGEIRIESFDIWQHRGYRISKSFIIQELVVSLLASPKWTKVVCIARKQLEEWKALPNQEKLVVETVPDLDDYFKQENNKYAGFDSLFCCFGSQTKHGE